MTTVAQFVLNPFQENTFIVYDENKECVIIDPGCYDPHEKEEIDTYIKEHNLTPVKLVNTHCHVDHVLGNKYIYERYNLLPEVHKEEQPLLSLAVNIGETFGINMESSPKPVTFLADGEIVKFGDTELKVIHTPGHSPGSVSLYCDKEKFVIVGDVLFNNGIGRYDFPASNYEDLMNSITEKLFKLGDDVKVFSGHGPHTFIGDEKQNNPFVYEFMNR